MDMKEWEFQREFYKKELFRKLKLNGYWNRLKSEQQLINRHE